MSACEVPVKVDGFGCLGWEFALEVVERSECLFVFSDVEVDEGCGELQTPVLGLGLLALVDPFEDGLGAAFASIVDEQATEGITFFGLGCIKGEESVCYFAPAVGATDIPFGVAEGEGQEAEEQERPKKTDGPGCVPGLVYVLCCVSFWSLALCHSTSR